MKVFVSSICLGHPVVYATLLWPGEGGHHGDDEGEAQEDHSVWTLN